MKLRFSHAPSPFKDFLIYGHKTKKPLWNNPFKKKSKDTDILIENGLMHKHWGNYGDYDVSILCREASFDSTLIFSGYLQHKGQMYIGQNELPAEIQNPITLGDLDGYFTFAVKENKGITITQDAFGKNVLFYHICDEYFIISNRYHLLLMYESCIGKKPEINYDKILLLFCSEDSIFSQQSVNREMFFEGHKMLTMTEKIIINSHGCKVEEKPNIVNTFYPKEEAEVTRLFEQGIEEIKESGRSVFSRQWKDGIKLEVTGGWDSRISAAAILASGNRNFEVRTLMSEYGDVVVSDIIANNFDLKRGNPNFFPRIPFENFDESIDSYRSLAMGFCFQKVYNSTFLSPDAEIMRVTGNCLEIYKNYLANRFLTNSHNERMSVENLVKSLVDKLSLTNAVTSSMKKRISNSLITELQKIPGELAQEKLNHHLLFHRLRAHMCYSHGDRFASGYQWTPGTSLAAFHYHNSIPYHVRYVRHPYIVNADLAHAVFPQLAGVPFSQGSPEGICYVLAGDTVSDVTHKYKNYDISRWNENSVRVRQEMIQVAKNSPKVPSEVAKEWRERTDVSYILKETLFLFDKIAAVSSPMKEILNSDLRERIKNCGLPSPINGYHVRLMHLADILECYNILSSVSHLSISDIDDVPRPCKIFRYDDVGNYKYDAHKIIKDNGLLLCGGEFADLSAKTPITIKIKFEMPLSDASKVELFSMEYLGFLLDAYENQDIVAGWKLCENTVSAYYTYLVWGPVNLWIERQQLPYQEVEAYAKRLIGMARMLKLAPECWYFSVNMLKIVRQHTEYLLKNKASTPQGEMLATIALSYGAEILNDDKISKNIENDSKKRFLESKEKISIFSQKAESFIISNAPPNYQTQNGG